MIVGVCDADISMEKLLVLFVSKDFVLLAGLYIAFQTCRVNHVSLNESQFLTLSLSIYGAILVAKALTSVYLLDFPFVQYSIIDFTIFLLLFWGLSSFQ